MRMDDGDNGLHDQQQQQQELAASFGLLQLYGAGAFVIVSKTTVEQAMLADPDSAIPTRSVRWPLVAVVVDAVQRVSRAALQPFSQGSSDLLRLALRGDAEAQFRLAVLLATGNDAVPADAELSRIWMQRAAQKGHLGAMRHLADETVASTLVETTSVPRSTLNAFLHPFSRIWADFRKRVAFDALLATLRPLTPNRRRQEVIPYLVDYDDDDDDDDF